MVAQANLVAELRHVAPGVHCIDAPQRFLGMELGSRMTVLETSEGVLIHSPTASDPSSVDAIGQLRWILAPNLFHHLHIGLWADTDAELWAAPGLEKKRSDIAFDGVVDTHEHTFGSDIDVLPLSCFPISNEVVLLHRPSRTLIVTDLVFNLSRDLPWITRATMWCLGGYPGCRTTILERLAMRRSEAREDLRRLLDWDFERVIMSHGDIIDSGGKDALRNAFHWL